MRAPSLRILLIDDNRHGLAARRSLLQELGHTVSTASSGQDGLDQFGREPFDVVVTDYRMPGLTGHQVIRKLRQANPDVPIVLLSGFVEALGLTEQSTGADIVVSKGPGEVPALVRAITGLAKKRAPSKPPASASVSRKGRSRAAGKVAG
jgi:CheY-like chemotaxis protein